MTGLPDLIRRAAEPLPTIDDPAFSRHFDRFADAKVVLLGEASHGTSEFYRARAAITCRLVEQHGFNIVAVEADWPDAASIDRLCPPWPAHARTASPPFAASRPGCGAMSRWTHSSIGCGDTTPDWSRRSAPASTASTSII